VPPNSVRRFPLIGLVALYWDIGRSVVERQRRHKWGDRVIDFLAKDLGKSFPGMAGFSRPNIYRMRAFYLGYAVQAEIVSQAARQLPPAVLKELAGELEGQNVPPSVAVVPWGHNAILINKVKNPILRLWYARKTLEYGWSRAILTYHIERKLHEHEGKAQTNFQQTLPPPQSDLAQQILKDPYNFDFLTLRTDALERELETGLLDHIQKFLLELGVGFAFVGRQVHVEVDGEDYYLDLLL
jgi:predicted nuclease of restriction endonuclease-like (RecB) superfamily